MGKHRKNRGAAPEGDYKVGYKRPPSSSRWAPGQSGNPEGRPPKQPVDLLAEIVALFEKTARTPVAVESPFGQGPIGALEAVIQGQFVTSLNDPRHGPKLIRMLVALMAAQASRGPSGGDDEYSEDADLAIMEAEEARILRRLSARPLDAHDAAAPIGADEPVAEER